MARIEESRRTYIEELATNPRVNLMVLSERIDIVFHEDESEVSLAEKIAEKLYDMPQLITKLLQQEAIEFLLQCWDMEGTQERLSSYIFLDFSHMKTIRSY